MTERSPSHLRRVCASGLLAAAAFAAFAATTTHADPTPATLVCDDTYETFKFPDATSFGWITADAADGDTVTGSGWSLTYTYDFDFTTKQATIHTELTSTTYALTGTLLWYVRTPDDGGLPIWDPYADAPSFSHDSVISFDRADFKAIYAISWRLQPCAPEALPPVDTEAPGGTTAPDDTQVSESFQTTEGDSAGSAGTLPATGDDHAAVVMLGVTLLLTGATVAALGRRTRRTD